jgi:anti-anti-sigma factor
MIAADAASESAQLPAGASLSVLSQPACTIAVLAGELDIATTPALRERLFSVLGLAVRLLIIDLSGVSFCDAGALAMLIGTQRRARWRGITVLLAAPSPRAARLLRITGLDRSFTICATLDEALPAQQDRPPAGASPLPAQGRPATQPT